MDFVDITDEEQCTVFALYMIVYSILKGHSVQQVYTASEVCLWK